VTRINCPAHGAGRLTLTADAGWDGIQFAAGSTWSGGWDFQGSMRFYNTTQAPAYTFLQRWIPGDERVAAGKTIYCVHNGRTIKGTRTGFGTDELYEDSTHTIGDGTGNGMLSPGDGAGGVGAVTMAAGAGVNKSHTLKFNAGSTYVVDINGTTTNAYDMVRSIGIGTGPGNVQVVAGAKLTVNLWKPTANTLLDATVIDGTGAKVGAGDFAGNITWNNSNGWSSLAATWIGPDLHVTGAYTAPTVTIEADDPKATEKESD
jgi:hypothetical protein